MSASLGDLLRGWRSARRLSLGALAAAAGLSKSTLSSWERDLHQPRLAQLEAVLNALGASGAERDEALERLDAPRGERARAAAVAARLPGVAPDAAPRAGDLLRAMRLRQRISIAQVADRLGVQASTVSRWEQSETAPRPERLAELFDALGARPQERAWFLAPPRGLSIAADVPADDLERLTAQLRALTVEAHGGDRSLLDLEFHAWEARLWPLAGRWRAARDLLVDGWARYALWLSWEDRRSEADRYARKVLAMLAPGPCGDAAEPEATARAVHVRSLVMARRSRRNGPSEAVEYLQGWLSATTEPLRRGAFMRDMADYAWDAGRKSAALELAQQSVALSQGSGNPDGARFARRVYSGLLVRNRQPERAILLLPPIEAGHSPFEQILAGLQWAETLTALGDRAEAAAFLKRACTLIEAHGYPTCRARADAVARLL